LWTKFLPIITRTLSGISAVTRDVITDVNKYPGYENVKVLTNKQITDFLTIPSNMSHIEGDIHLIKPQTLDEGSGLVYHAMVDTDIVDPNLSRMFKI